MLTGVSAKKYSRMTIGLLVATVVAIVVTLSTRNDWDQAPICASTSTASNAWCVTDKTGSLTNEGIQECSSGYDSYNCTDLPVDIRFADGTQRHLEFSPGGAATNFLDGGQRDPSAIPNILDDAAGHVIGRFHGSHLVGLRFPTTSAAISTDDYPGSDLHTAAEIGAFFFPSLALLASFMWSYHRGKRKRSR